MSVTHPLAVLLLGMAPLRGARDCLQTGWPGDDTGEAPHLAVSVVLPWLMGTTDVFVGCRVTLRCPVSSFPGSPEEQSRGYGPASV